MIDFNEIAKRKAHLDIASRCLGGVCSGLAKQASLYGALQTTIAGRHPDIATVDALSEYDKKDESVFSNEDISKKIEPSKGLGRELPVSVSDTYTDFHELDKHAYVGKLLRLGRRTASNLAGRGGIAGRVGRVLQSPIRSPIKTTQLGEGVGRVRSLQSPLGRVKAPKVDTQVKAGPYRTSAKPDVKVKPTVTAKPEISSKEKPVTKQKGLIRSLVPGALMATGAYGLYKGVPAAVNYASESARHPLPYNFGYQQYPYTQG